MVKTFIALRHMSDKEFGVGFRLHEKDLGDLGSEFDVFQFIELK